MSNYNHGLRTSVFPQSLNQAEIIPFYKKLDPTKKKYYRLASLLPHLSEVFERII